MKVGWDSPLSEELSVKFGNWTKQLVDLEKLKIPRCIAASQDRNTWSLHEFSDASSSAFAACAFLRCGLPGNVSVQLVMARSRVAPIKDSTIPRLELVGCLCGARLADKLRKIMELPSIPITYWTDSTTALAWIKNDRNWGVFVAGRVKEIRQLSSTKDWRHVPGKFNPADIPSRGANVKTLIDTAWWEGPTWLKMEQELWPKSVEVEDKDAIFQELKKTVVSHINLEQVDLLEKLSKHADYHNIVRIVAYTLRWRNRVKPENKKLKLDLPVIYEEFESAEKKILKLVQMKNFTGVSDPKLKNLV